MKQKEKEENLAQVSERKRKSETKGETPLQVHSRCPRFKKQAEAMNRHKAR